MQYDYLIVGAGFFGSVFAYRAKQAGKKVLVIDRRPHIGGNAYTEQMEGINVHRYGAHIFHTSDQEVWDFVNQFATFHPFVHSPMANYQGELYSLPFNMHTFAKLWGIRTPREAQEIIQRQRIESGITDPSNMEEQALLLLGRDVYEKLIKGYTEKQWGKPCHALPASIIKRIPLRFAYDNNYFNDQYQGIPIGGYTQIFEKLLAGVEVMLNTDFFTAKKEMLSLADKVIYTGTIDGYYGYQFGALEYRSLRFETKMLPEANFQDCAVVNYTDRETPYTRIIEHKHFEFGSQDKTVITHEYPMAWERDAEPYYPVNDEQNTIVYKRYEALARGDNQVIFGGRLGKYHYCDMDRTIADALCLAKNLDCK